MLPLLILMQHDSGEFNFSRGKKTPLKNTFWVLRGGGGWNREMTISMRIDDLKCGQVPKIAPKYTQKNFTLSEFVNVDQKIGQIYVDLIATQADRNLSSTKHYNHLVYHNTH